MKSKIIKRFGKIFKVGRMETNNGVTVSVLMFNTKKDLDEGNAFEVREGFACTNSYPAEEMIDARIKRLYRYYKEEKKW